MDTALYFYEHSDSISKLTSDAEVGLGCLRYMYHSPIRKAIPMVVFLYQLIEV